MLFFSDIASLRKNFMEQNKTKQKYALVTGGSRGIGRAVCIQLAKDLSYNLLINYNGNKDAAQQTLNEVKAMGAKGEIIQFDVTNPESVNKAFDVWHENNKDAIIEVIINNAGITKDGMFMWMKPEDWHSVINTSLNGFYNVTNALIQKLLVNT